MKEYFPTYKVIQNEYRVWYNDAYGKLRYEDMTEENEERVTRKFNAYFPWATLVEINVIIENVRCR